MSFLWAEFYFFFQKAMPIARDLRGSKTRRMHSLGLLRHISVFNFDLVMKRHWCQLTIFVSCCGFSTLKWASHPGRWGGRVATSFTEARVQREINFCCGELLRFADVSMFSICFPFSFFFLKLSQGCKRKAIYAPLWGMLLINLVAREFYKKILMHLKLLALSLV